MIAVLVHDGIHATFFPAADKDRAFLSEHHPSRVRDTARVQRDRKPRRQLDALQRGRVSTQTLRGGDYREHGGDEGSETTRHGRSSVAGEAVTSHRRAETTIGPRGPGAAANRGSAAGGRRSSAIPGAAPRSSAR